MGGQNHQPTRSRLTAASAWLSQKVGEGLVLVLEANNQLENAIIVGMNKIYVEDATSSLHAPPPDYLRSALESLERSTDTLTLIEAGYGRLLESARTEGYTGNPLAQRLASFQLGPQIEGTLVRPFLNRGVWQELEDNITEHNILETLAWEADQFRHLRQPTADLIAVMHTCLSIAEQQGGRAFVDAIENNEVPLRQYYAQVFSLWNHLHAMFLYSALMMTELFYRASGFPSLLEFQPTARGKSAA